MHATVAQHYVRGAIGCEAMVHTVSGMPIITANLFKGKSKVKPALSHDQSHDQLSTTPFWSADH